MPNLKKISKLPLLSNQCSWVSAVGKDGHPTAMAQRLMLLQRLERAAEEGGNWDLLGSPNHRGVTSNDGLISEYLQNAPNNSSLGTIARWWQLKPFLFSPWKIGERWTHFDVRRFFKGGWFNHQTEMVRILLVTWTLRGVSPLRNPNALTLHPSVLPVFLVHWDQFFFLNSVFLMICKKVSSNLRG